MKKHHLVLLSGAFCAFLMVGARFQGICSWGDVIMTTWISGLLAAALL